jgi:hypothetical protein
MIHPDRINQIIDSKNHEAALAYVTRHDRVGETECWAVIDGCIVIYDENDNPNWLNDVLAARDDDGNTGRKRSPAYYLTDLNTYGKK